MLKVAIDAIRARSSAANDGPWVTDYIEMARKTVVRRAAKWLPDRNLQSMAAMDEAYDFGRTETFIDGPSGRIIEAMSRKSS